MIRTAFVLGAGLGTRLRPLTEVLPKPLVPVCNRPLITYAFDHLLAHGIGRFVVNTHWLADTYPVAFPTGEYRRAPLSFRHEPEILETAGGIKNVEDLLGSEPFLVYNGDILTDLPLAPALRQHRESGAEVTMVLRSKDGPLQVAYDAERGTVSDIGSRLHPEQPGAFLFTGIYLVQPEFLRRIPPGQKISVIPFFLEMIREGRGALGGIVIDDGVWWDLGSREKYLDAHQHAALEGGAPWVDPSAHVAGDAVLTGATAIGAGARVGTGARVHDSVLWAGAEIAPGAVLEGCVVTGRVPVSGTHHAADL